MSARRFSYSSLLKQRIILAGLTLGLVAVAIGVMIDIFATSKKTTIPPKVRQLIQPLNPQLNLTVIEKLEKYELVTLSQARQGARQFLDALPARETPVDTAARTTPQTSASEAATASAGINIDPDSSTPEFTPSDQTTPDETKNTTETEEALPFGASGPSQDDSAGTPGDQQSPPGGN